MNPGNSLGVAPGSSFLVTGPYMLVASPSNNTVSGVANAVNFLSGGWTNNATLTGGNQGDYFIGGPGTNVISAGSGDDTIYAHPRSGLYKNKIAIDLSSTIVGTGTTPSVSIALNGTNVAPATPITAAYPSSSIELIVDTSSVSYISSVVVTVTNTSYTDQNNYSNVELDSMTYNGRPILLSSGQYPDGGSSSGFNYSNNGTVTFTEPSFATTPPYPATTSDTIDGGGGTNTVIYWGPSSNYTVTQQSNGSWRVASASTAEGPDTLTNIQILQFSDMQMTLP